MPAFLPVVLLVSHDAPLARGLAIALSREFTLVTAPDVNEASLTLRAFRVDAVIAEHALVDGAGTDVLAHARRCSPDALRVLVADDPLTFASNRTLATVGLLRPFDARRATGFLAYLLRTVAAGELSE